MEGLRAAVVDDHRGIVDCIIEWWSGVCTPEEARERTLLVPRLFLQHFADTSLVLDTPAGMGAFMVGFRSQSRPEQAYAHFLGVSPRLRGRGVGGEIYSTFNQRAADSGCSEVHAITTPANGPSVAMHRSLGFDLLPGDKEVDGLPVHSDYDGPGQDRVHFRKMLG